jgi:hypothetical protein
MEERLPAHLEATAIIRRVEAEGGFAAVLKKGDPDRGALTLIVLERGGARGILEREMAADFRYRWALKQGSEAFGAEELQRFVDEKRRFDPDFWLIELDVAEAERFIAETISAA